MRRALLPDYADAELAAGISLVGLTDQMVLHQAVELARFIQELKRVLLSVASTFLPKDGV